MSDTPAWDALTAAMTAHKRKTGSKQWWAARAAARVVADMLAHPSLVVAALIESGWRPTDDQLRAMGGKLRMEYREAEGLLYLWRFPKEATDGE